MHTIYYLVHRDTDRRLRWYKTLAGARIAQRQRNSSLGFLRRLERIQLEHREYERCQLDDNTVVDATWVIEENWVESPDLLE